MLSAVKSALLSTTSLNLAQARQIRVRKLPWIPRAKSKQFRVPELHIQDPEEKAYMTPIWDLYKLEMQSIYQVFKTVGKFTDQASQKFKEEKQAIYEREQQLLAENDRVNKEILERQLLNEKQKLEKRMKEAELTLKDKLIEEQKYKQLADLKVKKLKKKLEKAIIDPNNLEYEIEKMLNERVDYNFSVDSKGHFYRNKINISRSEALCYKK
jgi:hypothetical protein